MSHLPPSTAIPDTDLLTVKQVAALLQISVRTMRRNIAEGKMPDPTYVGARAPRWGRAQIMAWIEAGGFNARRTAGGAA